MMGVFWTLNWHYIIRTARTYIIVLSSFNCTTWAHPFCWAILIYCIHTTCWCHIAHRLSMVLTVTFLAQLEREQHPYFVSRQKPVDSRKTIHFCPIVVARSFSNPKMDRQRTGLNRHLFCSNGAARFARVWHEKGINIWFHSRDFCAKNPRFFSRIYAKHAQLLLYRRAR